MFNKFKVKEYDIIIDDGCHRFDETIIFLIMQLINFLTKVFILLKILFHHREKNF